MYLPSVFPRDAFIPDPRLGLLAPFGLFTTTIGTFDFWDVWMGQNLLYIIILYTYFGVEHTCSSDVKTGNPFAGPNL